MSGLLEGLPDGVQLFRLSMEHGTAAVVLPESLTEKDVAKLRRLLDAVVDEPGPAAERQREGQS